MLSLAETPSRHPADRLSIIHGAERWTFGALEARSTLWACWLIGKGVKPDDLVAFSRPNGPEFIAIAFGIYKAGATPAPISGRLPAFERDAILAVMQPRLYIDLSDAPDVGAFILPVRAAASWKACTSGGSTGTPKVIVDGRPASFPGGMDFIGIPENAPVLVPGPLYHNASFSAAIFALWKGCTVCTMDRFDEKAALQFIVQEKITWSIMVPTMLHRIWKLPQPCRDRFDLSRWSMVVHTAAPMAPWLKQAWIDWMGAYHIWEVYGATEGLVRCWIGGRDWLTHPGSVGQPTGGAQLRILDDHGDEVSTGIEGEVYAMPAGGPKSSYRYIGAERRATADGWESVGDIGHVDEDGYLYLADRRTDLIISGGVNIWPAEVEAAILRHPDVVSCAVQGMPDPDMGQIVHAVIEMTNSDLTIVGLSAFLSDYLARAKHPRTLTIQENAVRDDAGKFRKHTAAPNCSARRKYDVQSPPHPRTISA
jgi:bile acid-coenzyme A ligase